MKLTVPTKLWTGVKTNEPFGLKVKLPCPGLVTRVAETLLPSVASLRVGGGDGRPLGSGSAVAISEDGFLVTSAHVVAGAPGGTATFGDGRELPYEVTGLDRLSDLAVVRTGGGRASKSVSGGVVHRVHPD